MEMPAIAAASKQPLDEPALIARAGKDRNAFAALYRLHHPVITRYVYRRVGDPHVAEDLSSNVFLAALRYFPRYRNRGLPLRSWLYRIACNEVNRWARRQRRHANRQLSLELVGTDSRIEDVTLTRELARAALLTLAPKYQTVLALHYLEGLSVEEVARTVGCRPGTVKSRLSRGRDALRTKLQRRMS